MNCLHLPNNLRGIVPALNAAKILGVLPYTLTTRKEIRRSKAGLIFSAIGIAIYIIFIAINLILPMSVVQGPIYNMPTSSLLLLLICAAVTLSIIFPLQGISSSLTRRNVVRYEKLLHIFQNLENLSSWNLSKHITFIRWCNIFMLVIYILIITVTSSIGITKLKMSYISPIYSIWTFGFVIVVCQLFCSLVTIMKYYFESLNGEIEKLTKRLRKNFKFQFKRDRYKLFNYVRQNLNVAHFDDQLESSQQHSIKNDATIAELVVDLRDTHLLIQKGCSIVDEIFSMPILLLYAFSLLIATVCLCYQIVSPKFTSVSLPIALGGMWFVVMCALLAWAAGEVTEVAGERASWAAAALLVAARGRPVVERQVRLFLLQLRARPVRFCAGGLFPLDLRFFVGLVGTIVGYIVIVVQFAQPSQADERRSFNGLSGNCTCNWDCM